MKKYFENTGNATMYVGNTMIPPGEGKLVDVADEVAQVVTKDAGPSLVDVVRQLLERSIAEILPDLPGLTHEALDLAHAEEIAGKNRKTLLTAIDAERIRRANEKLQADQERLAAQALEDARATLLAARVALVNLGGPDADPAEREAAIAAVDEAQAKVDALTPDDLD